MLTERQVDALKIIRDYPNIRAKAFGEKFWPDHDMHKQRSNGGHGSQRGKAGWLAAGSYLAKLRHKGWTWAGRNHWEHQLSTKGKKILENHLQFIANV